MASALEMFPFTSREVRDHFISAEQLMTACDQVWSTDRQAHIALNREQPRAASSIYCKVDHLVGLFDCIRKVRNRIVLVSSESDRPITNDFFQRCPPQVAHWFTTNKEMTDDRLSALPLGLANSYCGRTLKAPLIAENSRPFSGRAKWLYLNFRTATNPQMREPAMHHFRGLRKEKWVTVQEAGLDFEDYLDEMSSYRFVLCPPGNGTDTHRLWEALYSRTIPVALGTSAMDAFADLPVLFVNDFAQLTPDFLSQEYERITSRTWNWPKLFLPWWRDRIVEKCEVLRRSSARMVPHAEFLRDFAGARLAELKSRVLRKA